MDNLSLKNSQSYHSIGDGIHYSLFAVTVLNTVIALIMIVLSVIEGQYNGIISIIASFSLFIIITSILVFICSLIIGFPVIKLLEKLKIDTRLNAAIAGGLSVLLFSLFLTNGNIYPPFLIMSVYGFFSGFGLMHGYKKGANL